MHMYIHLQVLRLLSTECKVALLEVSGALALLISLAKGPSSGRQVRAATMILRLLGEADSKARTEPVLQLCIRDPPTIRSWIRMALVEDPVVVAR